MRHQPPHAVQPQAVVPSSDAPLSERLRIVVAERLVERLPVVAVVVGGSLAGAGAACSGTGVGAVVLPAAAMHA